MCDSLAKPNYFAIINAVTLMNNEFYMSREAIMIIDGFLWSSMLCFLAKVFKNVKFHSDYNFIYKIIWFIK